MARIGLDEQRPVRRSEDMTIFRNHIQAKVIVDLFFNEFFCSTNAKRRAQRMVHFGNQIIYMVVHRRASPLSFILS